MCRHRPFGPFPGACRNPQAITHTNPGNPQDVVDGYLGTNPSVIYLRKIDERAGQKVGHD